MLGKLISYEFKTTRKTFGLIYLVLLICSLLTGLMSGSNIQSDVVSIFTMIIVEALIIAAMVILIRVVIKMYSDELYGSQAYLNRTLPVKPWQLLLAKLIVIMIWTLLTVVCIMLCLFVYVQTMISSFGGGFDIGNIFEELTRVVTSGFRLYWAVIIGVFFSLMSEILLIGLVITITACFNLNKGKSFVSVLLFFLIGLLSNWIFRDLLFGTSDIITLYSWTVENSFTSFTSIGISIALGTIYFLVTAYLLKKKADLI